MSKERRGFIVERAGKLYVRISYTDSLGKRHELMRRAQDRKHARQLQKELTKQLNSVEQGNQRAELDAAKITFAKVADRYESAKLIPAQYIGDRKIAGLRSIKAPKIYLRRLVEHFGSARIRSITHSQIDAYRLKRLNEGLSIASTNRELSLLRSVFSFAKQECIVTRTPFEMGAPLISAADEVKRTRVLSREEEERLLLALSDDSIAHIRPLVIAAIDTGCRKNELLTLRWGDVNVESSVITIRALNSKTAKSRQVPLSARLKDELQRLRRTPDDSNALIFNSRNLQKAFATALRIAVIDGFRLHDCRRTFCVRLIEAGMPIEQVSKLSGHTQISTLFAHYFSTTAETIQKATDILNSLNSATCPSQVDGPDYIN